MTDDTYTTVQQSTLSHATMERTFLRSQVETLTRRIAELEKKLFAIGHAASCISGDSLEVIPILKGALAKESAAVLERDAALAEIDELRKALDELGAPVDASDMPELVKCGTFTEEAQKQRDFVSVEKSLFDALRKDRERLDKLERLHDDGPWPDARERRAPDSENPMGDYARIWVFRRSRRSLSFETCRTLREAIDAIPEEPCRS